MRVVGVLPEKEIEILLPYKHAINMRGSGGEPRGRRWWYCLSMSEYETESMMQKKRVKSPGDTLLSSFSFQSPAVHSSKLDVLAIKALTRRGVDKHTEGKEGDNRSREGLGERKK